MEVTGKVRAISNTQEIGSNGFKKRDIVVTTEEQYPQHISIQFVQDKTSLLDNYNLGDNVKVSINLRGREWTNPQGETVYFNTIQGWKIERLSAGTPTNNTQSNVPPPMQAQQVEQNQESEYDDLPF